MGVVISGGGQRAREMAGSEDTPGEVAARSTAYRGPETEAHAGCQNPLEVRVC